MTTDVHQVGQKGPGLPTVVLATASVREGGANIVSTAMQSWGGMASLMPMTASHVSSFFLSLVTPWCPTTPTGVVVTLETMTPLSLTPHPLP